MKRIYLLLLPALLVLASCSEDDPTPREILIENEWLVTSYLITEDNVTEDIVSSQDPCDSDNYFDFLDNGNYIVYDGDNKCNATDPDIVYSAGFAFDEAQSKLTIDGVTLNATTLNETTMIVEGAVDDDLGEVYIVKITFSRR